MYSWNLLGVLCWVIAILYLVFVIQNIRRRRIKMIITQHKHFSWANSLIDLLEIIVLVAAGIFMINRTAFDNPDLRDASVISSSVKYSPLILTPASGNSYYVTTTSAQRKYSCQVYHFYQMGKKVSVSSNSAAVASGKNPMSVDAQRIPFKQRDLLRADRRYQRAYVATYTGTYKDTPQNGLGLHSNHVAVRYYLIRVPDGSFVRQK